MHLKNHPRSNSQIIKNHYTLEEGLDNIIHYGIDLLKTKKDGQNTPEKQVGMILESLILRACALWEGFIEREVILLVLKDTSCLLNVMWVSTNTKLSEDLVRAILFSDRYKDFHDIGRTKGTLKKYISSQHNIFESITKEQIDKIAFTYKLRNYLSHYSSYSKQVLLHEYKRKYNYKVFLSPAAFLTQANGRHFESLIHNFKLASVTMKKGLV